MPEQKRFKQLLKVGVILL